MPCQHQHTHRKLRLLVQLAGERGEVLFHHRTAELRGERRKGEEENTVETTLLLECPNVRDAHTHAHAYQKGNEVLDWKEVVAYTSSNMES